MYRHCSRDTRQLIPEYLEGRPTPAAFGHKLNLTDRDRHNLHEADEGRKNSFKINSNITGTVSKKWSILTYINLG